MARSSTGERSAPRHEEFEGAPGIHAYLYDAEGRDRLIALDEVSPDELGPESLLWMIESLLEIFTPA